MTRFKVHELALPLQGGKQFLIYDEGRDLEIGRVNVPPYLIDLKKYSDFCREESQKLVDVYVTSIDIFDGRLKVCL